MLSCLLGLASAAQAAGEDPATTPPPGQPAVLAPAPKKHAEEPVQTPAPTPQPPPPTTTEPVQPTPAQPAVTATAPGPTVPVAPAPVLQTTLDKDRGYQVKIPRLRGAPVIDGKIDDEVWKDALLLGGFTQMEPNDGQPSAEKTEVRIGYDSKTLYVSFRCFSTDPAAINASSMNRDADVDNEDHVEISIDTFLDKQNAFIFVTNPLGAIVDGTIRDNGEDLRWDWDSVWAVSASQDSKGWTAEFAIPFASLRFPETDTPVFGINFARFVAKTHELSFWKPLQYTRGIWSSRYKVSSYGELGGFQDIQRGNLFDLRPYVLLGAYQPGKTTVEAYKQGGLDLKIPLTSSLILDFTVNPDFAEAEADEQVLNLTRFPLLLPEKRDFFKEGQALFYFGDRLVDTSNETLEYFTFFQSRTIGLAENGQATVPVIGGARITGKIGNLGVGIMNLTTDDVHDSVTQIDQPVENYSVVRLQYLFSNGSTAGGMFLNKQGADQSYNRGIGADANVIVADWLRFGGYLAKTGTSDTPATSGADGVDGLPGTPGTPAVPFPPGHNTAGSGDILLQTEHFSIRALYSDIGVNFNPEMGYLTRPGIHKFQAVPSLLWSPPVLGIKHMDLFYDWNYVTDRDWNLLTRLQKIEWLVLFNNGMAFAVIPKNEYERLTEPFNIYGNVTIPTASYDFKSIFLGLGSDLAQKVAGILWIEGGQLYGGHYFHLRPSLFLRPIPGLIFQTIYDFEPVTTPWGNFTSHIFSSVATYAFSPTVSARATVQYASNQTARENLVLNWNYMPGANAYLVLNEQRDLVGNQPWLNETLVAVKFSFSWGLPAAPIARPVANVATSAVGLGEPGSNTECLLADDGSGSELALRTSFAEGTRNPRTPPDQNRPLSTCDR